jgi:excisionase family DNA binding protein
MDKKYYAIKETAKLLGVTPLTLRNWDKSGKLKAYRNPINNYRVYKAEEIELFLRRMESKRKLLFG